MKQINSSVLSAPHGIICHQANCQGVMGAGLAKVIRNKWPEVYTTYRREYQMGLLKLGYVSWVYVGDKIICNKDGTPYTTKSGHKVKTILIASLCAQKDYRPRGMVHTDYQAIYDCLVRVRNISKALENMTYHQFPINIPVGIGCGLAGGDWTIVEKIILDVIPDVNLYSYT